MLGRKKNDGYIYIATNRSMPGLVKIGMTSKSPHRRLKELYTTGVPYPFKLQYEQRVKDVRNTEQLLHQILAKYRVTRQREFFEIEADQAIRVTERTIRSLRTVQSSRNWGRWLIVIVVGCGFYWLSLKAGGISVVIDKALLLIQQLRA